MVFYHLVQLVNNADGINIHALSRGLSDFVEVLKPVKNIFKDVPQVLLKLLARKSIPLNLVEKARSMVTVDA